jgi:hypothetical protein
MTDQPHWYVVSIRYWPDGEMEGEGFVRLKELQAWSAADAVTQVQLEIRGETAVVMNIAPMYVYASR